MAIVLKQEIVPGVVKPTPAPVVVTYEATWPEAAGANDARWRVKVLLNADDTRTYHVSRIEPAVPYVWLVTGHIDQLGAILDADFCLWVVEFLQIVKAREQARLEAAKS